MKQLNLKTLNLLVAGFVITFASASFAYVPAAHVIHCNTRTSEVDPQSPTPNAYIGEMHLGFEADLNATSNEAESPGRFEIFNRLALPGHDIELARTHFKNVADMSMPLTEKLFAENKFQVKLVSDSEIRIQFSGFSYTPDLRPADNTNMTIVVRMANLKQVLGSNTRSRFEGPAIIGYTNNSFIGDLKIPNVQFAVAHCSLSRLVK